MGFKVGAYLTIWKEGNNFGNNYHCRQCSTNRKDQNTGEYVTDFSAFVRFVGKAKDIVASLPERTRIRIKECEVTTYFSNKTQRNEANYAVWDCEVADSNNGKKNPGRTQDTPAPIKENPAPVQDEEDGDGLPF